MNMQNKNNNIYERPTNIPANNKQQCICSQLNNNVLEKERIRLRQDFDMFFNRKPQLNVHQQIQINLIKWQASDKKDSSLECRVIFPVMYNNNITNNQYVFGEGGGVVKLQLDSEQISKKELQKYLRQNNVQIIIGNKYKGTIPLYKILSSNGNMISISINEHKNKREILKGHCYLKLIRRGSQSSEQPKIQQNTNINTNNNNSNSNKEVQNGYMWIYIQNINFIKKQYWKQANIFLKLVIGSEQLKTKTVWNSNQPTFNQIFTIQQQPQINIQVYNKQQQAQYIGNIALPQFNHKIVFDQQLPIMTRKLSTVGYLTICVGKGTIIQANNFIRTHYGKRKPQTKQNVIDKHNSQQQHQQPKQQDSKEKEPQQQYRQSQRQQSQKQQNEGSQKHNNSNNNNNNNNINHNNYDRIVNRQKNRLNTMNILQAHNAVFTKLYNQHIQLGEDMSVQQFEKVVGKCDKLVSTYMHTQHNQISIHKFNQSYQAFKVYYQSLTTQLNAALKQINNKIQEQGYTINEVQYSCEDKLKYTNTKQRQHVLWKTMNKFIGDRLLTQKLRYFYEHSSIYEICDVLRKYEVFGIIQQQIPYTIIQHNIKKEIYELLQIPIHHQNIQHIIQHNQIQLSIWEELNIYDNNNQHKHKHTHNNNDKILIKSPTFGVLGTDRVSQHHQQHQHEQEQQEPQMQNSTPLSINNYSPEQIMNSNQLSSIKLDQPSFPRHISPINTHQNVVIKFSSLTNIPIKIVVNESQFIIQAYQQKIPMPKKVSYIGSIIFEDMEEVQFEGFHGEWIGLVDNSAIYRGCIIFT